jgi:hypothetical protein
MLNRSENIDPIDRPTKENRRRMCCGTINLRRRRADSVEMSVTEYRRRQTVDYCPLSRNGPLRRTGRENSIAVRELVGRQRYDPQNCGHLQYQIVESAFDIGWRAPIARTAARTESDSYAATAILFEPNSGQLGFHTTAVQAMPMIFVERGRREIKVLPDYCRGGQTQAPLCSMQLCPVQPLRN